MPAKNLDLESAKAFLEINGGGGWGGVFEGANVQKE